MQKYLLLPTLLVSSLVLGACVNNQDTGTTTPTAPAAVEETAPDTATDQMMEESAPTSATGEAAGTSAEMMESEDAVDATLDMANFSYTPNQLTAAPGETLRVRLNNVEGFHDFVIDELDVASAKINAGQEVIVEIPVPEDAAGESYEFYCSVGSHRQMGMVGTLVVTE